MSGVAIGVRYNGAAGSACAFDIKAAAKKVVAANKRIISSESHDHDLSPEDRCLELPTKLQQADARLVPVGAGRYHPGRLNTAVSADGETPCISAKSPEVRQECTNGVGCVGEIG
jgi:hypothetical protein